jgi:hypothetical protein
MTRDFLVHFDNAEDAANAAKTLAELKSSTDGVALFGEIDNRGDSLFLSLTYPHEIRDDLRVVGITPPVRLLDHAVFVAIKNGMHDARGFFWCRGDIRRFAPADGAHIKSLHGAVLGYFGIGIAPPHA